MATSSYSHKIGPTNRPGSQRNHGSTGAGGSRSSSQAGKKGSRKGKTFKNSFKNWKRGQESDGTVFISTKSYIHPGWARIDPITKANNKLKKIMAKGVPLLRVDVENLNRKSYSELNSRVEAAGGNSKYTKMDKSERRWYNATRKKGGQGGDLNHDRLILEPRNTTRKSTRAMWSQPNYQTAGFSTSRVGLDSSKSMSSKYMKKRVANNSKGLRQYENVVNHNQKNPRNPFVMKAMFDPGAIARFTDAVSKQVNIMAGLKLGQWAKQAAAETGSFYVNFKGNSSKSKHYHKRVNVSQDPRNIYKLIGTSMAARFMENRGAVNPTTGTALNRYTRWVIGSFKDNAEYEQGSTPTGVYAQGMSTSGPSLTEIRLKSQGPFKVKTGGKAIPFGDGTKDYRRSGKEGQVFRKLKGGI